MAKMTEAKKEALAVLACKGLVAAGVVAALWFFIAALPHAIDKELAIAEARTAAHLSWLEQERMQNR